MLLVFMNIHVATAQDSIRYYENRIQALFDSSRIVGAGASIIVDNKVIWSNGYGYADRESKKAFTPKTIMNIASITKTFTGACIMKAVEDGLLDLDKDINEYLPFKVVNPFQKDKIITLRNLTTHTASLRDRSPLYSDLYVYGKDCDMDLEKFIRDYFLEGGKYYDTANFLNKAPGSYREYCNTGYALAGYVLEKVTKTKLPEYCSKNIFNKLGMNNSGWTLKSVNLERHTKLYDAETDVIKNIEWYTIPSYPDGAIRTSVEELSRFFIALLNGGVYQGKRILKTATVNRMLTFQFTEQRHPENVNIKKLNSGIGWATKQAGTFVGHAGSDPGVKTEMLYEKAGGVGVILFTNTGLSEKNLINYHYGIFDCLVQIGRLIKESGVKAGSGL